MELGASKEDYLKLIYLESEPYGSARVSSVAAELKYSKPTVSATFSKLEALGLIKKKPQKLQWEPKPENSGSMPMSRDERREDILETIGECYGKGRSTTIEELSRYFGNTESEIKRYLAELTARQQIFPVKGKQDLIQPTQHGIIESQNAMKKHKIMSEFFQLIGVDQEKAEDDVCRMEHIVSDDSIMCLNSFLRNDGRYQRAITGYNLHSRYAVGTYPGIHCFRYIRINNGICLWQIRDLNRWRY